jgi:CBS domain containing-hemolysin-like protein
MKPSGTLVLALRFRARERFFVASEFALVKVRPTQLAELLAHGSKRAKMTKRI